MLSDLKLAIVTYYFVANYREDYKALGTVLSGVTDKQIRDFKSNGMDVDESFVHTIDNFAVNHTLNSHGTTGEADQGQLTVVESDFGLIPGIINGYDNIEIGKNNRNQDIIKYSKTFADGQTYYIEEVRVRRKELAMVTMYKRKGNTDDALNLKDPASDTPLTTSDSSPLSNFKDTKCRTKSSGCGK